MRRRKRFTVYLAGPVTGCNDAQVRQWRDWIKERWSDDFDLVDPVDRLIPADERSYEIVEQDLRDVERSDAVLANMWRASIGTAIGVVHARTKGKVVVVVDQNHIASPFLAFYADSVATGLAEGMRHVKNFLRTERSVVVLKKSGAELPFSRTRLVESIRAACRAADCNDIVVPLVVLPHTLDRVADHARDPNIRHRVTTTDIERMVLEALEELEDDDRLGTAIRGVRAAWERYVRDKNPPPIGPPPAGSEPVPYVPIRSSKSHSTIWGKTVKRLADVPREPRRLFEEIMKVPGIAEIRLSSMSKAPKVDGCRISLHDSKTPGMIEGKLYDNAPKGQVQSFQVRLHDPRRTAAVRRRIESRLEKAGALRSHGRGGEGPEHGGALAGA